MITPRMRKAMTGLLGRRAAEPGCGKTALGALGLSIAFATPVAGLLAVLSSAPSAVGMVYLVLATALVAALGFTLYTVGRGARTRRNADVYSTLIDSVRDAVVRYAPDGSVAFLSRSAEGLFGCRRYELDGPGLGERVHVMDRPAYLTALDTAIRSGNAAVVEIRMRREGTVPGFVWVEFCFSPVGHGESGPHEVIAVLRDITARKEAEAELERAHAAVRDASDAKSRFLATIGHELRTPLNAIVGFSDMMEAGIGGTLSPAHQEYAGLIRQGGHHLLEIINMLLDMSKIEAGRFELATERFDPAVLAEPCLHLVRKQARDRAIDLVLEVATDLPPLCADERACRQILINLLSNAVKFSRDGGRVTLAVKRRAAAIAFSVTDMGIGMGPEIVGRLGEPFYQAQDGLTRQFEGTGLGLSIVKGLVGLHNGQLEFHSRVGKGTTVTVILPISGPGGAPVSADIEPLRIEPASKTVSWPDPEQKSVAR